MDHATVQTWLDRYVDAWRTYDEAAIGDLFTEDAEYRYHPWDEPVQGRAAIVKDWLDDQDAPGTWEARYKPYAVDGDKAVATGISRYDSQSQKAEFHNAFLLEFAPDGRARSFTEIFATAPQP
jgi:ketosteroid isomerase-like protein